MILSHYLCPRPCPPFLSHSTQPGLSTLHELPLLAPTPAAPALGTFLDQIHSTVLGLWGQFAPLLCLVQVARSSQRWGQEDHGLFPAALRKPQEGGQASW